MKFSDYKQGNFVKKAINLIPADIMPLLEVCDFESLQELKDAVRTAWYWIAESEFLTNKECKHRGGKLLWSRAKKITTAPNVDNMVSAIAEGLWVSKFERVELNRRREVLFNVERDNDVYNEAKRELQRIYKWSDTDMECLRYFVCQCRRNDSDPALNRALYLWSEEKMTGKTTIARIVAGILNGYGEWRDIRSNGYMSDIPCELQFGTFDRPKATRFACVVMDEAFAGKSTAKYYGKFKAALTSGVCDVQIKFGGTFPINITRNYLFTSNHNPASVIADTMERRIMAISMRKPEQMTYEKMFGIWKDYIVNAPDEEDVAEWYRETMQAVKGEAGIQVDDLVSAFLSDGFRQKVILSQNIGIRQMTFPKDFSDYVLQNIDSRKETNIIKEAVVQAFGKYKESGRRKYYNISELLPILNNDIDGMADTGNYQAQEQQTDGDDLPF